FKILDILYNSSWDRLGNELGLVWNSSEMIRTSGETVIYLAPNSEHCMNRSVGLPRTQEGLQLLSHKEEVYQLRPQLPMLWSLNVMVQVHMIEVIKLKTNLPALHSWLSHPLPQIHLLTV
nr:hypothetical protein [Tanacetum cinerariifolium]